MSRLLWDTDDINICAPIGISDNGMDIQALRKGIFAEVFIMYIVYLGISFVSHRQNPSQGQPSEPNQNSAIQPAQQSTFINSEALNKFFSTFLGYHIIPIGMSLLYSPYAYSIVIAYLHLLGFFGVLVGHKLEKDMVLKAGYGFAQFMNLLLIFGAIVCLGSWDKSC